MIGEAWTLRNEQRDFVEWHRGRAPYVLWALDVDTPEVRTAVAQAAAHLRQWLLPDYRRQPHVTVDLCGFPAADEPVRLAEDEFNLASLQMHCAAMATQFPAPFTIEVGALSSFSSAPYLQVHDPAAALIQARAALATSLPEVICSRSGQVQQAASEQSTTRSRNGSHNDYVPHVTVGLYADAWPAAAVNASLLAYRNPAPLRLTIDRLSLLAYQPQEIGGHLHTLGAFCLIEQCWRPASLERRS